jgi:hypothetical protein
MLGSLSRIEERLRARARRLAADRERARVPDALALRAAGLPADLLADLRPVAGARLRVFAIRATSTSLRQTLPYHCFTAHLLHKDPAHE